MEGFSSTGQLVTLNGLVDSSIGAMAEGLALFDMEACYDANAIATR